MRNQTKNKITTLILFLVMFVVLTGPLVVLAQSTYTPLAPLDNQVGLPASTNLGAYANALVKILIGVAAVLAIIMIMIGGLQYMSTDAISGKTEGKERITQALFGLGLAIASWLILATISPTLLKVDLTVTSSGNKQCSSTQSACANEMSQLVNSLNQRNCTIQSTTGCLQEGEKYCFVINYTCQSQTTNPSP